MKPLTLASLALALILASPGDAKDNTDISANNPSVAPQPDRPPLKRGDSGGDVPILQKALNNHGEHLRVDGIFGRQTEKAVKAFQAQSGLESTGEVDSGTWSALTAQPAPVSNPARELETAREAADQAKAQAEELAKRVASLNSELGIANAQRNELRIKLDLAMSEAESAQSQLKDKQSYLERLQSELDTAKQDAERAKVKATKSLNSELEKGKAQRNEPQIRWDQGRWKAEAAQCQLMIKEMQSELETARQDAEQAKAQATVFAHWCAIEKENVQRASKAKDSGDQQTSDSAKQPAMAFGVNEQPPTIYVDTPDASPLATAHIRIGNVLKARGDLVQALESYRDGLAVANREAKANPKNAEWQLKITLIYIKIGEVFMAQGKFAEALKTYRDALPVADRLARFDPENAGWQQTLSVAYNKIGDTLAAEGNLTEALQILQDSLAIREHLAKADASNIVRQRDLAMSQGYVAAVLAQQGDRSRALGLLQQARVIIARLLEQSPDNHQLSEDLAMFVDNIAKLEQAKAPGSGAAAAQPEQAVR
jgi:peptidoglycan hydrolase-like protein with peptidoglycan-binding domain